MSRAPCVSQTWRRVGFDTGVDESAQHKLVPTISFSLDNVSDQELGSLQVQGMFRRAGEEEGWGSAFVRAIGREGLGPGGLAPVSWTGADLGFKHSTAAVSSRS